MSVKRAIWDVRSGWIGQLHKPAASKGCTIPESVHVNNTEGEEESNGIQVSHETDP